MDGVEQGPHVVLIAGVEAPGGVRQHALAAAEGEVRRQDPPRGLGELAERFGVLRMRLQACVALTALRAPFLEQKRSTGSSGLLGRNLQQQAPGRLLCQLGNKELRSRAQRFALLLERHGDSPGIGQGALPLLGLLLRHAFRGAVPRALPPLAFAHARRSEPTRAGVAGQADDLRCRTRHRQRLSPQHRRFCGRPRCHQGVQFSVRLFVCAFERVLACIAARHFAADIDVGCIDPVSDAAQRKVLGNPVGVHAGASAVTTGSSSSRHAAPQERFSLDPALTGSAFLDPPALAAGPISMTAHAMCSPAPPLAITSVAPPGPRPSPLKIPTRDAEQVRLRLKLKGGLVWTVSEPDSPWAAFEMTLPAPDGETSFITSDSDSERLSLLTAHGVLELRDDLLIAVATGVHLPRAADAPTREGLLRLALGHWPTWLAAALGGTPSPLPGSHDVGQARGHRSHTVLLTLVEREGARVAVPIRGAARTLIACVGSAGWRPLPARTPMPPAIAAITFHGGLWLDRLSLTTASLSSLRPGDALWLPPKGRRESSPLCLISGGRLIHLGHVSHLSREFRGWGSEGGAPSNSPHAFSPPTEPRNVDALTVDLDFIVGRVAMTVGELCALAAGQVVPLEALKPAHVRIVAHGTELGCGQLVDVEGRMAVEILEWGSPR